MTIRLASGGLCNDPSVTQIEEGDGEESFPGLLAISIARVWWCRWHDARLSGSSALRTNGLDSRLR